MISIIVSSYNEELYKQFASNVASTIGVPFEIIQMHNLGKMGICEAYNKGIKEAKYNTLCFAHEDILFASANWGQTVTDIFKDTKIGLIGVAGNTFKTFTPSAWSFVKSTRSINIIQHYKFRNLPVRNYFENPKQARLASAACVDGVWMCTTKNITEQIRFDEETFKSFHCYDLDFSLQVLEHYKVVVTFDVVIEHFSEGRNDKQWIEDSLKFAKKWQKKLPINLDNVPREQARNYELLAAKEFVYNMRSHDFPLKKQLRLLIYLFFSGYVSKIKIMELMTKMIEFSVKKNLSLNEAS